MAKEKENKRNGCIVGNAGNLFFVEDEVANGWKEYITELYDDNRTKMTKFAMTTENNILQEKIRKAINSMKNGQATRSDEVSTEILKALDDRNVKTITKFCNIIYKQGTYQLNNRNQ